MLLQKEIFVTKYSSAKKNPKRQNIGCEYSHMQSLKNNPKLLNSAMNVSNY